MNVAFVVIQHRTAMFHGVARRLEAAGHNVHWISPSRRWSRWLVRHGTSPDSILDVWAGNPGADWRRTLAVLERSAPMTMRDVAMIDRLLRRRPYEHQLRYLATCVQLVEAFLAERDILSVVAEPTWALELVTWLVCLRAGVDYHSVETVRIPDDRFTFFPGIRQERLAVHREPAPDDAVAARRVFETFASEPPKPRYAHQLTRIPGVELAWPFKFVRQARDAVIDRRDETREPVRSVIRSKVAAVVNDRRTRGTKLFSAPEPSRPYVLYGLHKQPENSIDVWAPHLSNQPELVRAIARSVPSTHDLYVKAHPNALGDFGPRFFRQLRAVPGVRLIDPMADGAELARRADLVVTVSGTMAFEAALMGRPAVTFVPMYFDKLLAAGGVNPFVPETKAVFESAIALARDAQDVERSSIDFLSRLVASSYRGIVSDPISDPEAVSEDNLDAVSAGFLDFLSQR